MSGWPSPTLFKAMGRNDIDCSFLRALTLKFDVGDRALPIHRFVDIRQRRRQIVNEVTQIVEDGPAAINLHTVQQRRAVHHYDVRTRVDLRVSPFLEPVVRASRSGIPSVKIVAKE